MPVFGAGQGHDLDSALDQLGFNALEGIPVVISPRYHIPQMDMEEVQRMLDQDQAQGAFRAIQGWEYNLSLEKQVMEQLEQMDQEREKKREQQRERRDKEQERRKREEEEKEKEEKEKREKEEEEERKVRISQRQREKRHYYNALYISLFRTLPSPARRTGEIRIRRQKQIQRRNLPGQKKKPRRATSRPRPPQRRGQTLTSA